MSSGKVKVLTPADALGLGRDLKIVAIRWDLVPWGLVLDGDVPSEGEVTDGPIRRAWMTFTGLSEITWSLNGARLPNGIFGTNALVLLGCFDGFYKYELPVLAPTFFGTDKLSNNPHDRIIILSKGLIGATSMATGRFGAFGPDRRQRNSLASEEDFLQAIGDSANPSGDESPNDEEKSRYPG
jgi:hypothetical protein